MLNGIKRLWHKSRKKKGKLEKRLYHFDMCLKLRVDVIEELVAFILDNKAQFKWLAVFDKNKSKKAVDERFYRAKILEIRGKIA